MPPTFKRFGPATVTMTGAATDWAGQLMAITPTNNTPDGDTFYTFGAGSAGVGRETVEPDWSVVLSGKADWSATGISRYMHDNDGATVTLTITFDTGVTGWTRRWVGDVVMKEPTDGGEARTGEAFETTLQYYGKPVLTYL